ncbi:hypothetical protein GTQ34_10730 [Muricauda sp. JGD-17]|uniref:Lipocalin-like domain-containing protein n=1 Tax=Flagellimonas ochracea TaxID=2696472 RepID=A0A964WXT5_9FLAO|nr:hypothetical protein [Allomuricauda ochracea]NAY92395.1 hypothetical protein [Allomuricauda ochracea]
MKNIAKHLGILLLALSIMNTSCRKEEFESLGTSPEQALQADSNAANLLFRTSLKDGSTDNILDQANCFSIALPVTVIVNGTEITVEEEGDLDEIELIFEESDDDTDSLEIVFPVTITFSDYTETMVSSAEELEDLAETCPGENEVDDDIECVDIVYPISVSIFNPNTELFDTISLDSDEALNDFIEELDEDDIVNIEFPIVLVLTDNTELEISDLEELENTIEGFIEECDEDDDNDFDDDNCNDCTVEQLQEAFAGCADFGVNKFSLDGENLKSQYDDLAFSFEEDGNLTAASETEVFLGTWSASGSGNDILVVIDIPSLNDFNAAWNLNRILETPGITKITLHEGDGNTLRFQDACTNGNPGGNAGPDVDTVLEDGIWQVDSYMDGAIDETANFVGYNISFNNDGTVVADNGTPINGTWSTENGNTRLVLDFADSVPFEKLNMGWEIDSVSDTQVELRELGGNDILVLTKQ